MWKNMGLHSQTIYLFTQRKLLSSGFTNGLLKWCCCVFPPKHFFSSRQCYWLWAPSFVCVSLCVHLCLSALLRFPPAFSPLLIGSNVKEKSLSHPLAHSPVSLRADSHLREARPQGCVLASWQVPSVKQGLCVLAVYVLALGPYLHSRVRACVCGWLCICTCGSMWAYVHLYLVYASVCMEAYVCAFALTSVPKQN